MFPAPTITPTCMPASTHFFRTSATEEIKSKSRIPSLPLASASPESLRSILLYLGCESLHISKLPLYIHTAYILLHFFRFVNSYFDIFFNKKINLHFLKQISAIKNNLQILIHFLRVLWYNVLNISLGGLYDRAYCLSNRS